MQHDPQVIQLNNIYDVCRDRYAYAAPVLVYAEDISGRI